MSKLLDWLHSNGTIVLASAVFFVLGVAMSYPLGWKLPGTIATLFGSVAGAVGAVGGAFLLWQGQERRAAHSTARSIRRYCEPLQSSLLDLSWALAPENIVEFERPYTNTTINEIRKVRDRLKRLEGNLLLLGADQLDAYLQLEIEIGVIEDELRAQYEWISDGAEHLLTRLRGADNVTSRNDNLTAILGRISPHSIGTD